MGICCILISVPIFLFPNHLPKSTEYKSQRVVETHNDVVDSEAAQSGFGGNIKDFPRAVKLLLTNWTFLMLNLAAAADCRPCCQNLIIFRNSKTCLIAFFFAAFVVMGAAAYGPKM